MSTQTTVEQSTWQDVTRPVDERVDDLVGRMTLQEKVAQLVGVWVGASDEGVDVAPHQHDLDDAVDLDELLPHGLGQLTRPFGTVPVDPAVGALSLMRTQERILAAGRHRVPALAHEECLAGLAAWGATAYPVPLAWGASFDPDLVQEMASRIGSDMRSLGVHQGLAPVLDVVRDARWGRVEETIGEDPYLVGAVASAYVRGLEGAGVVATLKHFVGYSASRAGRNLAPSSVGRRELADVLLPPFEMVVAEGHVRSVMNSYADVDGVPAAADRGLLTGLLRETWGFTGTVVADYFSVAFLKLLHGVAGTWAEAAVSALVAGIDVELPTVKAFGEPLRRAVSDGVLAEDVVDTAVRRVLRQKAELGLLDAAWSPRPPALAAVDVSDPDSLRGTVDLDSAENRAVAARLAEESVVLLQNDGVLPLQRPHRVAVVGPNATDPRAVLGCYSFPVHVGVHHPDRALGIELPTLLDALSAELDESVLVHERGTSVDGGETDGIPAAVAAAAAADVVVLALGDRAGLFGRGTSGEGCDVGSLRLPGAQQQLLDAVLATGTPAVVVLLSGRPYALGEAPRHAAAVVQAFFAGEEGTRAIAGVLSGRVNPSGRLPVSVPARPDAQPSTYLAAPLARRSEVSAVDPTPQWSFGHGLSYTRFVWDQARLVADEVAVDGTVELEVSVGNTGHRAGTDVVQVYLRDPVASVVQPVRRLVAFARVSLAAGASARVRFALHTDLTSFTGVDGRRVVEPGELVLEVARSSHEVVCGHSVRVLGSAPRVVDHTRVMHPVVDVSPR